MTAPKVGILAYQGSVDAHADSLQLAGARPVLVKHAKDLADIEGLIIPGGESTTLIKLLARFGLADPIAERIASGLPVFGTCAGLILLAKNVIDGAPSPFGSIDITAQRNAYGRQVDSFTAELAAPAFGETPLHGVFIRAPRITSSGPGVEVLAEWEGEPVAARQGHVMVASFHPELTDDTRVHEYFLQMIKTKGANMPVRA